MDVRNEAAGSCYIRAEAEKEKGRGEDSVPSSHPLVEESVD